MSNYKPYYTLEEALQRVYDFESLLAKHNIDIRQGSDLYRISFNVLEYFEKHKNPALRDNKSDIRPFIREVLGFNDFIAKIYSLQDNPNFAMLLPHLQLMNTSSSIPMTTKSLVTDQGSNKLFELYIASLCMHCFDNVKIENPSNSNAAPQARNPDIMFDFNKRRWAISCKVMHSDNIKTMMDTYAKGIDQIKKCAADVGIVIISLRNIIDYNELWPILNGEQFRRGAEPEFGAFVDIQIPVHMLAQYGIKIRDKMLADFGFDEFKRLYENEKSVPGFLLFCQAATGVVDITKSIPIPTILRCFNIICNPEEITTELSEVLSRLNSIMQSVQ